MSNFIIDFHLAMLEVSALAMQDIFVEIRVYLIVAIEILTAQPPDPFLLFSKTVISPGLKDPISSIIFLRYLHPLLLERSFRLISQPKCSQRFSFTEPRQFKISSFAESNDHPFRDCWSFSDSQAFRSRFLSRRRAALLSLTLILQFASRNSCRYCRPHFARCGCRHRSIAIIVP